MSEETRNQETTPEEQAHTEETAAEGALASVAETVTETAETVANTISETVTEAAAQVAEQAQEVVSAVAESAADAAEKAADAVESMGESPQEAAEESAEAVAETVTETAEEVTEAVAEPMAEAAEEVVEAVAEPAAETAEEVTEAVAEPLAEVAEAAEEAPEAVAEPVAEAVEEVTEAVAEPVAEAAEPVVEAAQEATAAVASSDDEGASDQAASPAASDQADADGEKQVVYLSVGQEVTGKVKRVTEFGAFVDIGAGRDGLIHISEMAVGRVNKVNDVLKEGQQITCWIKKLDRKRNRISLTLVSPNTKTIKDLSEGDIVPGTVSKIMPYGAFIDLGVGTDGLLHIREMSTGYVNKPEDVVQVGEGIEVRIIAVDRRRRRIDLSLKGLRDEPEAAVEETASQAAAVVEEEEPEAMDSFAEVEVLSPMELAFKRAIEADGSEVNLGKADKKTKRSKHKNRAIQEEIINRTLSSMKE